MKSRDELKWQIISNGVMGIVSLAALLPFMLLIVACFTDVKWSLATG